MLKSLAKLNDWDREARESPLNERENPPMLSRRFWFCFEGISLILVTVLGLVAACWPLFSTSITGAMNLIALYITIALLQLIYVWLRPKQRWKSLHASSALMQYFITPLRPFGILGPFIIAAHRRVLLSFISLCCIACLGLNLAAYHQMPGCASWWMVCTLLCAIVICLYGPLTMMMEAAYWKRHFKRSFQITGMILSTVMVLLFIIGFLICVVGGSWLIDLFTPSIPWSSVFVLACIFFYICLFWLLGRYRAQKLYGICETKMAELFEGHHPNIME